MQDDNETTIDDDFDDLDFDDIDMDDDFDDESWDDFDDSPVSEESVPDMESAKSAEATPAERTFLQKNFNLIVIVIAVLGGGTFMLTQFGGQSAPSSSATPQSHDAASAPVNEAAQTIPDIPELNEGLPPQPTAIEGISDEDIALVAAATLEAPESLPAPDPVDFNPEVSLLVEDKESESTPDVALSDDVLTPLPDFSLTSSQDTLSELDLPEVFEAQDVSAEDALPQDFALQEDLNSTSELLPIEDIPLDTAPTVSEDTAALFEDAAPEEISAPLDVPKPAENTALLEEANKREQQLSAELTSANNEISTLNTMVDELKQQIETLSIQAAQAKERRKSEAKPTPAPAPVLPKITPQPVTKPVDVVVSAPTAPAPKIRKSPKIVWTLRSVGRGKATLASQNGDVRQVAVGHTVPQLGRIQSIAIEGDRWVVKGTKGRVSQ